jgi:hypothetical protein
MNKGIVMELSDRHIIVMTSGGVFRKLPRDGRTCEVGEEILFAETLAARKTPPMAKLSGFVAAVVMCVVVIAAMTNLTGSAEVVAYVSMDINPSVEFGIDSAEKVQDLKGLNEDGAKLVSGIDYKGKPLETVTNEVLRRADEQGPLAQGEGDIIIASALVKNTDKISDSALADKLKEQVTKYIATVHPNEASRYEVTAFAAPQEIRQAAEANGLSTGKYAIYLAAKNNGTPLPLDDFKKESVHQLAQQNGGIEALVDPRQPPAKGLFKQLLEEEKSGKLDERAKQLAEQRGRASQFGNGDGAKNTDDKTFSKTGANNDARKAEPAKTDDKNVRQQAGKNGSGKDNEKKDSNARPNGKPAGGTSSSGQGSYINKGKFDNRDDNKQSDNNKQNDNKQDDNKQAADKTDDKSNPRTDDKADAEKKSDGGRSGNKNRNNGKRDTQTGKPDDHSNDRPDLKNGAAKKDEQN